MYIQASLSARHENKNYISPARKKSTGSVAEWLALVTLIHVLQRTGGSRFEHWFELCSYRWILGEFSFGDYPTVSHLLVH